MSRPTLCTVKLLSLGLLVVAAGCAEKDKGMTTVDQDSQRAADRIRDLEAQLAQADRDRDAERERILSLENELNGLRDKLAHQGSPAPGWNTIPGGAMTSIEGTVLFDSGKAVIKPDARKALADVARTITERFAGHEIYIFGHTDNEPIRKSGWADNEELSCGRALAVMRHIRGLGVQGLVVAGGWGQQRPATENSTGAGRQSNRRVEIYAVQPEKITGSADARTPARR